MANRFFNQFAYSLEKAKCFLFLKAAIGATGAVTIDAANSKGITSITRNSAGRYTVVLQDTYVSLLGFKATIIESAATPTVAGVAVVSETVATAATKNVVFQCIAAAGTAVDPASGSTMKLTFELSNSGAL